MSSQPCGVVRAESPVRSSTVVVADSTIAGPSTRCSGTSASSSWTGSSHQPPSQARRAPPGAARRPRGEGRLGRHRRQPADDGETRVDEHRFLVAQRVRVQRLVSGVERIGDGGDGVGSGPVDVVERHLDLEDLLAVAHVRAPAAEDLSLERGLGETRASLGLHLAVQRFETPGIEGGWRHRCVSARSRSAGRSRACPRRRTPAQAAGPRRG